jgi:hypothetical protein
VTQATEEKTLTTADLAAAAEPGRPGPASDAPERPPRPEAVDSSAPRREEQLAPLFSPDGTSDFQKRWDAVQIAFVDDPRQAVQRADELVAQVMKSLAETFSNERAKLEGQLNAKEGASTENLRVALQRYRSFFQRLLSL